MIRVTHYTRRARVESIRTGILRVIDDRAYREQLVVNGFENIKRFQVEHIAKQYADLYREIQQNAEK